MSISYNSLGYKEISLHAAAVPAFFPSWSYPKLEFHLDKWCYGLQWDRLAHRSERAPGLGTSPWEPDHVNEAITNKGWGSRQIQGLHKCKRFDYFLVRMTPEVIWLQVYSKFSSSSNRWDFSKNLNRWMRGFIPGRGHDLSVGYNYQRVLQEFAMYQASRWSIQCCSKQTQSWSWNQYMIVNHKLTICCLLASYNMTDHIILVTAYWKQ